MKDFRQSLNWGSEQQRINAVRVPHHRPTISRTGSASAVPSYPSQTESHRKTLQNKEGSQHPSSAVVACAGAPGHLTRPAQQPSVLRLAKAPAI